MMPGFQKRSKNLNQMKTKLVLSALLVVFSMQAFAQDVTIIQSNATDNTQSYSSTKKTHKPRFWIGPKFGTDIVSGIPSDFTSVTDRLKEQWQAGVMMQLGRTLYLQPEAYYSVANTLDGSGAVTATSQSIKVPVMVGLRFLNLGLFSLHIMGGPSWTIPMGADNAIDMDSKQMDWLVGAGIDVLGFITADIRYRYDTGTPLSDQIAGFNVTDNTAAMTPLNVTVGLKLR
jgi:opacity protein-like surface antigen